MQELYEVISAFIQGIYFVRFQVKYFSLNAELRYHSACVEQKLQKLSYFAAHFMLISGYPNTLLQKVIYLGICGSFKTICTCTTSLKGSNTSSEQRKHWSGKWQNTASS